MEQGKLFKKIIIVLSLSVIILFGAIYFVYAEIRSKNQKIFSFEQELQMKNNKYDYLVSMQKLVENIEPDIQKINNSIVSKSGDVGFIENLEAMARSHDLDIKIDSLNLVSDPKAPQSTLNTLKIKAKADGSWSNVYIFLSELESSPFKIKIDKFAIISGEELVLDSTKAGSPSKKWQTSFEISVLEYK